MYTLTQRKAIYKMAKEEKKVFLPTQHNRTVYLVLKLWRKGDQLRAYLNYVKVQPRYNGGTNFRSDSLGYINLRTGDVFDFNPSSDAWEINIAHMEVPE